MGRDGRSNQGKLYKNRATLKMRSLTELVHESRMQQTLCDQSLEKEGISNTLVSPGPIPDKILVGLLRTRKKHSSMTATQAKVEEKINSQSAFAQALKRLDPKGSDAMLQATVANKTTGFGTSGSDPRIPDELVMSSLADVSTSDKEYTEFWNVVRDLNPRATDGVTSNLTPEGSLYLSLDWLANKHGTTLGDGVNLRGYGTDRSRLVALEQYVRISQTTMSVLLNDSQENGNTNAIMRPVILPHVALWVVFEASRCVDPDVLSLIASLVDKAKKERRYLTLNPISNGDQYSGENHSDALSLSSLSLVELEGLSSLTELLFHRVSIICQRKNDGIEGGPVRTHCAEREKHLFNLRRVVKETSQVDPDDNSRSGLRPLLQNPMARLLLCMVDHEAESPRSPVEWPSVGLYNAGKLKKRSNHFNVEIIIRDVVIGWPWFRLMRAVQQVEAIKERTKSLQKEIEEMILHSRESLYQEIMQWHHKGVPSFPGLPFCSPSTFASLLTLAGRSDLGIIALLQRSLKSEAKLVADVYASFVKGNAVETSTYLIKALASPIIFTPTLPGKADNSVVWARSVLRDTASMLLDNDRLSQNQRLETNLTRMLQVAKVLDNFLEWPDEQTLNFMGQHELVPLDAATYEDWAVVEPSLGLRLLEAYTFSLHKSFSNGSWAGRESVNRLRKICYHLNAMCDVITDHIGPDLHQKSALPLSDLSDILDVMKSRVSYMNMHASGKLVTGQTGLAY